MVKAEWNGRSLRFFYHLYITRGGLAGTVRFSYLEVCRMGKCLLTIFVRLVSPWWFVVIPGAHSMVVVAVVRVVGVVDGVRGLPSGLGGQVNFFRSRGPTCDLSACLIVSQSPLFLNRFS